VRKLAEGRASDPRVRARLGKAAAAFSSNARNPSLRRAQLSFLGAWTAEWAFTVGLGIVAYSDGGATAVGLVGLLRMAPSAILAPLLSPLADRGRRERVLILVSTLRGIATGAAAVVVGLSGPTSVVYVLAVLSTIATTLYRPAHSALLPSLCRTGYELASANVVRGLLDSAATLVGPLLAALLLQVAGVAAVFSMAAAASLWAALLLTRLRYEAPPRPPAPKDSNLLRSAAEGVRAVSRSGDLALIMGLAVAQTLVRGALTVLTVVVAIDLLDTGPPGVGFLNAAIGAGAVLGSLAASLLVDTRRLGGWFAVGVSLWGVPVILIGVVPEQAVALLMLACLGVGNALIDLGGFTLMGRMAPDEVLARVFGVLESLVALSMGVGAIVTSLLLDQVGVRTTLVIVGVLCPICALLSWPRLRRMDRNRRGTIPEARRSLHPRGGPRRLRRRRRSRSVHRQRDQRSALAERRHGPLRRRVQGVGSVRGRARGTERRLGRRGRRRRPRSVRLEPHVGGRAPSARPGLSERLLREPR